VALVDRLLLTLEQVLGSEAKTARAVRLLRPVLLAVVGVVFGLAVIVALLVTSVPWFTVTSVLGGTVAGGGGAALVRCRRRSPPPPDFTGPGAPSSTSAPSADSKVGRARA